MPKINRTVKLSLKDAEMYAKKRQRQFINLKKKVDVHQRAQKEDILFDEGSDFSDEEVELDTIDEVKENVDVGNVDAGNVDAGNVDVGNVDAGNVDAGNMGVEIEKLKLLVKSLQDRNNMSNKTLSQLNSERDVLSSKLEKQRKLLHSQNKRNLKTSYSKYMFL